MRDFALPIGHVTGTTTAVTIPVSIRRPFRQPLVLPDSGSFFKGTELWLEASNPSNAGTDLNDKLFVIFHCTGRFYPGTTPAQETAGQVRTLPRLVFKISDFQLLQEIEGISGGVVRTMMETAPRRIIYENVDRASVIEAIAGLLSTNYPLTTTDTNTAHWHPIFLARIRVTSTSNQRIKDYIDGQLPSGVLATICNTLATGLVDQTFAEPVQLPFKPGDFVGRAAVLPTADAVVNFTAPVTLSSPKFCRIVMQDIGLFELNPSFYFLKFLQNANFSTTTHRTLHLTSYAPLNTNRTFNHPFLNALNIDLDVEQLPRITVNMTLAGEAAARDVLLFPVSKVLNTWRGNQDYFPDNDGVAATSVLEWRINNTVADIPFEVRRRAGQDAGHTKVKLCGETGALGTRVDACPEIVAATSDIYYNRVHTVWNGWRTDIQDFCQVLQVPVENLVTTIGNEATSERAIAMEPIATTGTFYNGLVSSGIIPGTISNGLIASYNAMTKSERYGRVVPSPFNAAGVVSNHRAGMVDVTWGDIRNLIAAYFPHRVSPGITQTLVETAIAELKWLQTFYPNLATSFNVGTVSTATSAANNIAIFDWLLSGRHSILASVARHKHSYQKLATYFDNIRVGSAYNANGDTGTRGHRTPGHPFSTTDNVYGYRIFGVSYFVKTAKYYSAIRAKFRDAGNAHNGSPQFWQALPE